MEHFNFDIRECDRSMYAEFLDAIDASFGYARGWFVKNLGHILPEPGKAEDFDIKKNLVAIADGKIIGATGFYPMRLSVFDGHESISFNVCGVGQVSCLDEYRGHGVMTALLNAGIEKMRDAGHEISWLSGERARYANFGYELSGNTAEYSFYLKNLNRTERLNECEIRNASAGDIALLDAMYRQTPSYIERDTNIWERHLNRENIEWPICTLDGKTGYICRNVDEDDGIWEAAGDPECVLNLLTRYMRANDKKFVFVRRPYAPGWFADYLYKSALYLSLKPSGQLMIPDERRVFEKILPFIKRQCEARRDADALLERLESNFAEYFSPGAASARKQSGKSGDSLIPAIIRKTLGFTYCVMPPGTEDFSFLEPLPIFIPSPDKV